jgi:hypothetical protein
MIDWTNQCAISEIHYETIRNYSHINLHRTLFRKSEIICHWKIIGPFLSFVATGLALRATSPTLGPGQPAPPSPLGAWSAVARAAAGVPPASSGRTSQIGPGFLCRDRKQASHTPWIRESWCQSCLISTMRWLTTRRTERLQERSAPKWKTSR